MVEGKLRSRTKRRVAKRVTSGSKIFYEDRPYGKAKCALCGIPLQGVRNARNLNKTAKTVSRPFGGNLCSACMRKYFTAKAREEASQ